MSDSYVTSGAILRCSFGDRTSRLSILPDRTVYLTGNPRGNISDHIPLRNIHPFGKCHTICFPPTGAATAAAHGHLTPMPCIPGTIYEWLRGKNDVLIKGKPALLQSSVCRCQYGGLITVVANGQDGNSIIEEEKRSKRETEEEIKKRTDEKNQVDPDAVLDGIQILLDGLGFVPILGAAPDLLNASISACRGDWVSAGISLVSAVPGIGDAVGGTKIARKAYKIAKKTHKVDNKNIALVPQTPKAASKETFDTQRNQGDIIDLQFYKEKKNRDNLSVQKTSADPSIKNGKVIEIVRTEDLKQGNGGDLKGKIYFSEYNNRVYNSSIPNTSNNGAINYGFSSNQNQQRTSYKRNTSNKGEIVSKEENDESIIKFQKRSNVDTFNGKNIFGEKTE